MEAGRLELQYQYETKKLPLYVLGIASNGPKLGESRDEDAGIELLKKPDGSEGEGIR